VRRPNDYNPVVAATLGPTQPSTQLNLGTLGLAPGGGGGADGPDRVFVGGLPYFMLESQIRELLEAFGPLRALDLIRDKDTGNSKGYCFCLYEDSAVTDLACVGLNGMTMGDKTLTVRRASAMSQAPAAGGTMASLAHMLPPSSPVVVLDNAVDEAELREDAEFGEIEEDMKEELAKYGTVLELRIPRPAPEGEEGPRTDGLGRVYVHYSSLEEAGAAKAALHGRKFGGKAVVADSFDLQRFTDSLL
jgi:splicing factor U2AF subunit